MARIQAPDGTLIDFPDSMSDDQITQAMSKLFPPPPPTMRTARKGLEYPTTGLVPPGRISSSTINIPNEEKYGGPIIEAGGLAASTLPLLYGAATAPLPTITGLASGEAARRGAAALHAPWWVQAAADLGGAALGGAGTSRIGSILGLTSPAEESLAIATKYGGQAPSITRSAENIRRLRSLPTPGFTPTEGQSAFVPPVSSSEGVGISSDLPSGRMVGPAPARPTAPNQRAAPLWQSQVPDIVRTPTPNFEPIPPVSTVTRRGTTPDTIFQPGPVQPLEGAVPGGTPPMQPKMPQGMKEPDVDTWLGQQNREQLNRQAHALFQDMSLPTSPAGTNAHPRISAAAEANFGKSWSKLSDDQMRLIIKYGYLKRDLPIMGQLKPK